MNSVIIETDVTELQFVNSTFTAPVKNIFNHDIMNCTNDEVSGNYLYSGRALGLTEPGDIIQLHPMLEIEWPHITRHYERIGLSFTRDVIWDTSYSYLKLFPKYTPSFFYYGSDTYEKYENSKFYNIVNFINSKNNFMNVAESLGLPIPKTIRYDNKSLITDTSEFPYPCYLKAAVSVSGVGIFRCENQTELFKALDTFEENVPIQVQEEVVALSFLNVQYKATSKGVVRFAITDQLLDGFAHKGNQHPTKYPCWDITDTYAKYLHDRGMQGIFAFDVAVSMKNEMLEYRLIECNPRFNGASYPTWIAKKLEVENWAAEAFVTQIRSLADLDLTNIEFDPEKKEGIVLVNWGPVSAGKISVLLVGSKAKQQSLRKALINRL